MPMAARSQQRMTCSLLRSPLRGYDSNGAKSNAKGRRLVSLAVSVPAGMPISIPDDRTVSGRWSEANSGVRAPEIGDLDGSWIPGGRRRWPGGSPGHYVRFHRCIKSNAPRAPQKPQGREARRSCTLDGEDRTVQSRVQGKGGMARVAAAEPPSIRGFGFFDFVSIGFVAPTTCKSSICLTTCKGEGLSTNF